MLWYKPLFFRQVCPQYIQWLAEATSIIPFATYKNARLEWELLWSIAKRPEEMFVTITGV